MPSIYITATPFDFMRWGKEGFYRDVEEHYRRINININIQEMDVQPVSIDGGRVLVRYKVTATEYTYDD